MWLEIVTIAVISAATLAGTIAFYRLFSNINTLMVSMQETMTETKNVVKSLGETMTGMSDYLGEMHDEIRTLSASQSYVPDTSANGIAPVKKSN